jgi:hypothetical protein
VVSFNKFLLFLGGMIRRHHIIIKYNIGKVSGDDQMSEETRRALTDLDIP